MTAQLPVFVVVKRLSDALEAINCADTQHQDVLKRYELIPHSIRLHSPSLGVYFDKVKGYLAVRTLLLQKLQLAMAAWAGVNANDLGSFPLVTVDDDEYRMIFLDKYPLRYSEETIKKLEELEKANG